MASKCVDKTVIVYSAERYNPVTINKRVEIKTSLMSG